MASTRRSYFTSDLHLFARHSDARRHLRAISSLASEAEAFVFGGDIFDFRWATTSTVDRAADRAIRWLSRLTTGCPDCHFHFLLGNHDSHWAFTGRLAELEHSVDNMSWHTFHVRLGNSMFLHGDAATRRMMDERRLGAARARWIDRRKKGPLLGSLYDLAVSAKLHKPVPYVVYPKRVVAKRILRYLESIGQGVHSGVKHVYFGHTHRPLSAYQYGGLTFHNGGAPIKGMKYRILEAAVCV